MKNCYFGTEGTTIKIPRGLKVKRSYHFNIYLSLHAAYREICGAWARLELDWQQPVISTFGDLSLLCRKPSVWEDCIEPPDRFAMHHSSLEVAEYVLGHGCLLVKTGEGSTAMLHIAAKDEGSLKRALKARPMLVQATSG